MVKLRSDALIAEEKLRRYLLAQRAKNDKSAFFAGAGYTQSNWRQLADDIRQQLLPLNAEPSRQSKYGDHDSRTIAWPERLDSPYTERVDGRAQGNHKARDYLS